MLSFVAIIHASGVVLWSQALDRLENTWLSDVSAYLQNYVLRASSDKERVVNGNRVRSITLPETDSVSLVAGVPLTLHLAGIQGMLEQLLSEFVRRYDADALVHAAQPDALAATAPFTAVYEQLMGGVAPAPDPVPGPTTDGAEAPQSSSPEQETPDDIIAQINARQARKLAARRRTERPSRPTSPPQGGGKAARTWGEDADDTASCERVTTHAAPQPAPAQGEAVAYTPQHRAGPSILSRLLASVNLGTRIVADADLDAPLKALHQHLLTKNVPAPVAAELLEAVRHALVGQAVGQIQPAVQGALADAVKRLLTPSGEINILFEAQMRQREIQRAVAAGSTPPEPYKLCFVGVNGVGKTTTLAKIAFYLQRNGLRPYIAACDTFRSGAVEQLRTHAQRLELEVYDAGYRSDAATVCRSAIRRAVASNYDVLLIDTAGRMPGNAAHMRELGKLVSINKPDRILMVAEALVGNDSLEQLRGFNDALTDYATGEVHAIDALVLTKMDTVGTKVGTALSLVSQSRSPIVFVGVGQSYTDVEPLNVDFVTELLLSA